MAGLPTDPIDLPGAGSACLLLHGFSGSPFELAPLAAALHAEGHRVLVPVLAGHGHDAPALARTGFDGWLASAAAGLERLSGEGHRRVLLAGFSIGGCLATVLAAERPRLAGALALLAPALDFHHEARLYRDLFRVPGLARLWPLVPKGTPDLADEAMRLRVPVMPEVPTACASEVARAADRAREALPQVRAPALVLWGALDRVVPRGAAERAAGTMGSGPARLAVFGRSAHQLCLDVEREAVCAEVTRFFSHFHGDRAGAVAKEG